MTGEGGDDDDEEEDDPVIEDRTCKGFILLSGFNFSTADLDNLASLLYLGNQLGLTTNMVGVSRTVWAWRDLGA